jgi:hypothetical protein
MSDDPTKGQPQVRSMRSIVGIAVGAFAAVVVTVAGCGSHHNAALDNSGGGVVADDSACTTVGQTRQCHVPLAQNAGFVDCMAGTQTCDGAHFGACLPGGVQGTSYGSVLKSEIPEPSKKAPHGRPKVPDSTTGLHTLADPTAPANTASLCTADACDPYCYGWDDTLALETASLPAIGSFAAIPGGAQMINTTPCKTGAASPNAADCSYDMCCYGDNKTCVAFSSSTAGRCSPSSDNFGNFGGQSVGNCQNNVDYTLNIACDDVTSADGLNDTHVVVCNRGGVDDTANTLYIGFERGGNPGMFPYPVGAFSGGCSLNFALLNGGLASGQCGDLNIEQQIWTFNGRATTGGAGLAVDCSSMGATPAAIQGNLAGANPIRANTDNTFHAATPTTGAVNECNTENNWSFSNHQACPVAPPLINNYLPASNLPGGQNPNSASCTIGNTQADADGCQLDTCCQVATGACVDWNSLAQASTLGMCSTAVTTGLAPIAPGTTSIGNCLTAPDYTIAMGCNVSGSGNHTNRHFPVCNRGGVPSPAAGILHVGFGDDGQAIGYPFTTDSGAECKIDLAVVGALAPYTCFDLDACTGSINGSTAGVDCSSIANNRNTRSDFFDGTDRPVRVNGLPNSTGDDNNTLPECDGGNNFSFRKAGLTCGSAGVPPTPVLNYTYTAVCPPGSGPVWKWLSYKMGPPGPGDVQFNFTGQFKDPQTGVLGPASGSVTAADPPIQPAGWSQCDYMNHNPPCPLNLGDGAWPNAPGCPGGQCFNQGGTDIRQADVLNLNFVLGGSRSLAGWGIAYDCLPRE